jgi:hypothetical protein
MHLSEENNASYCKRVKLHFLLITIWQFLGLVICADNIKGRIVKTHSQMRGRGVIYAPRKTYCSIKHFIFLIVSTCLVDYHVWQSCVNKTWHVASGHSFSVTAQIDDMCGLEALIQRCGLAMTTQIVGLYLTKIVGSHSTTNWYRYAMVDQWICTYMNYFVNIWLSYMMVNRTSGYKWEYEKT